MDMHTRQEDRSELRELSADELETVAGGWPKWLERLFGTGGARKSPAEMTADAKASWPAGSHWTDYN